MSPHKSESTTQPVSPRREYSVEFKQQAVQMVTQQGLSVSEAAGRLGISPGLLRRWKRTLALQGPSTGPAQPSALELENRQLREEVRRLTMEREILKKAATFFAKESR